MKIGIITYYDVVNYGAVLLAYAMKRLFNDMGHEVVFLKYNREKSILSSKKTLYQRIRMMSPNAVKARRAEYFKTKKFELFRQENLKIGDNYNVPQDLDLIVVGSDQIFDCKYGFNDFQYAIHAACERVISYAPSFGEFKVDDLEGFLKKDQLSLALRRFNAHSARDKNTQNLLEILTGEKTQRVLDPTLLYGFEEEKETWNKRLIQDRYMIIYVWGGTTNSIEFRESVTAFARKNGLKTVTVGDRRPWCDIDFSSASPIEFFELFQYCDMVITNMFHGTCFSIINEKPFYSVVMPHNQNKLRDLLEFQGLSSQLIMDITFINAKEIPEIDYVAISNILKEQQKKSKEYLMKSFKYT